MTLDELTALPDRNRDALVATQVMGYSPGWTIPHYSTDPAADYDVLCFVREAWGHILHRFKDALSGIVQLRLDELRDDPDSLILPALSYQVGDYSLAALLALEAT